MTNYPDAFESVLGIVGILHLVEVVFYDEDSLVWRYQRDGHEVSTISDWFPIPQDIRDRIRTLYKSAVYRSE